MTPEQIRNELDQDEPRSSFPQYHMQSRQDLTAELVAYDQMSRESAQNRTLGASEPVWAPEGHPDAAGAYEALVQQIAEAIDGAPDGTDPVMGDWRDWINEARAVVPLVEAQVAPLRDEANGLRRMYRDNLQHLRAERDWWRHSHERWYDAAMEAAQGGAAAESALRQVRELADDLAAAEWFLRNLAAHAESDDLRGQAEAHADDLRAVLARVGAADTQPEGAGEVISSGHARAIVQMSEWMERAESAEATIRRVEDLADRLDARFLHEDADAIRRMLSRPEETT